MNKEQRMAAAKAIKRLIDYFNLTKSDGENIESIITRFHENNSDYDYELKKIVYSIINRDHGELNNINLLQLISKIEDMSILFSNNFVRILDALKGLSQPSDFPTVSEEEIIIELEDLEYIFGTCKFGTRNKSVTVHTKEPIVLTDDELDESFNFGKYAITLVPTIGKDYIDYCLNDLLFDNENIILIKPLSKRASLGNGLIHPHIDGSICLGHSENLIQNAFQTGRIKDIFVLLERFLHSYDPDNLYEKLEAWGYK